MRDQTVDPCCLTTQRGLHVQITDLGVAQKYLMQTVYVRTAIEELSVWIIL